MTDLNLSDRVGAAPLSDTERARVSAALMTSLAGAKLTAVILVDPEGQVLFEAADMLPADAPVSQEAVQTSEALHALAHRITTQRTVLSQYADHETHFFDWDGRQVIGKRLVLPGHDWLLVALCPAKTSYKQALTRLIKALETALKADPPPKPKRAPRKPKTKL